MAFVTADRTADTTTTVGTSPLVVSGTAPDGSRTFSAVMSVGDTCYYSAQHRTLNEWEVGLATYSSANTLTRTTVYSSSNSGSAVTFSAGTKDVFITMAASRSLQLDASGNVTPSVGGGSYTRTTFTATAGQTSFSATYTVNYVEVYLNGILLNSADYTATTGTTVVLAAAAAAGDIVDVVALNISFTSGVTASGTPASGQLAAWTSATSVQGVDSYPLWQSVQTGNFTAVAGRAYWVNTTAGAITVTLPASPTLGQIVQLTDYAGTWGTNNVTVAPNGSKITGLTTNSVLSISGSSIGFVYSDATQGWIPYSAFKTTFSGQPYTASYLAVAGGGGGGFPAGGGGGAGGLLASTASLTVGATYTITVGAGGTGGIGASSTLPTNGANSVISSTSLTVTATGGGYGGSGGVSTGIGASGGSGGGAGNNGTSASGAAGTSGQGFAGGNNSSASPYPSGGGGGSSAVGANGSGSTSGAGGAGTASSITGSSITYAGGGGGASTTQGASSGAGGSGGGGAGGVGGNGTAGTANLGGGGGGASNGSTYNGGAGGSGVVILSVPSINYSGTTTGSPTVTTSGSNTIIKFTASGSYTA